MSVKYYVVCSLLLFVIFSCSKAEEEAERINPEAETSDSIYKSKYKPDYITSEKVDLVAIVISSPRCGYCATDESKSIIGKTIDELSLKADSLDAGFMTVGVSVNWNVDEGYHHLKELSDFDEHIIGNNWQNSGALKYVFDDMPGTPGIPQLVLTKRTYDAKTDSLGKIKGLILGLESETLLTRKVGVNIIENWLNKGLPIDGF